MSIHRRLTPRKLLLIILSIFMAFAIRPLSYRHIEAWITVAVPIHTYITEFRWNEAIKVFFSKNYLQLFGVGHDHKHVLPHDSTVECATCTSVRSPTLLMNYYLRFFFLNQENQFFITRIIAFIAKSVMVLPINENKAIITHLLSQLSITRHTQITDYT